MNTPQAPLPDEVDAVIKEIPSFERRHTLRAHITAQAEKIAKLEADNKRLMEEVQGLRDAISNGYAEGDLDFLIHLVKKVNKAALAQTEMK